MNNLDYDEHEGIRRSDLWEIRKSPAHFKANLETRKEQTRAMAYGSALHKLILEPMTFFDEYFIEGVYDKRTKLGKAQYEAEQKAHEGQTPITIEDMEKMQAMKTALFEHPGVSELLSGTKEAPVFWTDRETGELCKIKPDCVTDLEGLPMIVDYKTTTSCDYNDFYRSCKKYGYGFQAGMYTEGLECTNFQRYRFAFIAQETAPPYAVRIFYCDPEFVRQGQRQFHDLLRLYHNCKVSDVWPGYEDADLIGESYD